MILRIGVLVGLTGLVCSQALAVGWVVVKLTDNSYLDTADEEYPCVSGSKVAWEGWDGSDPNTREIFLYDGTTVTQLTDNSYDDKGPQVSGSKVVWQGKPDGSDYEIFLFDGTTVTQLTDNAYDDRYPHVSGSNLVWQGQIGSGPNTREIFLYDGATVTQLTDNSYHDAFPRIWGSNVVWEGWDSSDPNTSEIFLYDGATVTQLTDNSCEDRYPQVWGLNVVWTGRDDIYPAGDDEIFLYDGSTVTQLTDNSYNDRSPKVSGSNVVWTGFDGSDYEIFLYDGMTVTQFWDTVLDDHYSQVSGSNVVWHGYDGSDPNTLEIFLARPGPPVALTVTKNNNNGDVLIYPIPLDANAPAFPPNMPVTLTAVPVEGKSFKHWKLYDPNYPGDANYMVKDSNNPITILMDNHRVVKVFFKCGGGGLLPMVLMTVGVLGLYVVARRKSAQGEGVSGSLIPDRLRG